MTKSGDSSKDALVARRLEELVCAHRQAVVSYVRRRAPTESVDDLVAETFLVAWRRLERVPVESPLPWLLAVARNQLATQRRAAGRRDALYLRLQESTPVQGAEPPSLQAPGGPVSVALASLGEKDREAISLIAWDGLRPREAATVLGESPSRFYVRLHRAKRRLRGRLEEQRQQPAEFFPRVKETKETTR